MKKKNEGMVRGMFGMKTGCPGRRIVPGNLKIEEAAPRGRAKKNENS